MCHLGLVVLDMVPCVSLLYWGYIVCLPSPHVTVCPLESAVYSRQCLVIMRHTVIFKYIPY